MRESAPQDETLVFLYDRLLLKPVRLPAEELMVPAAIDPMRMIEIRPYPAEGPQIGDLSLPEVAQVLQEGAGGVKEFGRDLLRLKRIVRRVRIYRAGVALVYKKSRSSDIQIAFIVDDARHEGLEHAFAERGGPKKMGFIKSVDESATFADLRRYLGPEIQQYLTSDAAVLEERRIAVSLARLKYQASLTRKERAGDRVSPEIVEAVRITSAALDDAQEQLLQFPARSIAPYEPAELLDRALETTSNSLMVSSRTLDRSVVDARFLKRLDELLAGGIRVSIALTEHTAEWPVAEIEKLRTRYPRLEVSLGKRGQFHYLISDNRFAAVTNRPFLSNLRKNRSFNHVVGYLLQKPELVSAFIKRVGSRPGPERSPREASNGLASS